MPQMVKAVVMTGPGKLEVQEFPYPKMEDGAMILKVEASGICGTDKHAYKGELVLYGGTEAEQRGKFPIIRGHENVGIIAEITDKAAKNMEFHGEPLKVGDRVTMFPNVICGKCWYDRHIFGFSWCVNNKTYGNAFRSDEPPHLMGGWAEYMYILPNVFIYKVPDDMPPEIAVLVEIMTCAAPVDKAKEFYSLASEGFGNMDTVVVQGIGPLGLAHLIRARAMGAGDIVAVDASEFRLNLAKEFGADYVLNVAKTTSKERITFVKDITQGRGADMVIECVGIPQVVPEGLEMLRRGGVYIEAGNFVDTGEVSLNVHRHLCAKNVRFIGSTNHPYTEYPKTIRFLQKYAKWFPFEKFVTHKFKLDQAEQAMAAALSSDSMKVIFTP